MMAFKFIGTLICFISVSSFEIKDDFEVVDQQAIFGILMDSFDFEVVYGLQDEYVLNSFGLRRNLLVDSDPDEVLNEDELKDDEFVLKNTGLRRKLLVDSDSDEVLNEDELKEDEFVLKNTGLRRKLLVDSDEILNEEEDEYVLENTGLRRRLSMDSNDYHYFLWLFCFFVFIFASKCLWNYIKDLNEIQLDTLISNSVV